LNYRSKVHRHLDWRTALDWLGSQPYLLAEYASELLAVLACPPDPPSVAWIRLFTAATELSPIRVWNLLLESTVASLKGTPSECIAALAVQSWFEELLIRSAFTSRQSIVVLEWNNRQPSPRPLSRDFILRPMAAGDLDGVTRVDHGAFAPLWQNSIESLTRAYKQAALSSVIELDGQVIGYQISTSVTLSGHLARLAVLPAYQGQGLGYALLTRLLSDFEKRGITHVTVNTQNDNASSLSLYTHAGFYINGDEFPVYVLPLS
jgi:ribosomal protein S18 acetylase RimI-like enzyme